MTDSFQLNHDPLTFDTGQKFGKRYKIIEVIGHGGMGKVFKAYDKELDIVVALKMIKPSLIADENVISRFKRELLLAREIQHDNVIRIHDLGEIDQIKYISMNYINGNSLNEIIESVGQISVNKSLDLAKQICCALSAAHAKGIVHRDLKPQNIMIDKKGKLYVLDFGIARSLRQSSHTTEPGVVIGTPDIMSPEQIQGEKADERSDIYALGVIWFQMVTGELPFIAEDYNSLLYKHVNEPVPTANHLNPLIPSELSKIIARCMEKNPQDRFQSIEELNKKLDALKPSQWQAQGKRKRKKHDECVTLPSAGFDTAKIKIFKTSYRIIFILLILYGLISVLSLVTDAYYDVKVDQIKAEYNTYYKSLFPIKKEWVQENPALKEANTWTMFTKIFPLKTAITSPDTQMVQQSSNQYIKNILSHPEYDKMKRLFAFKESQNFEGLEEIVKSYGRQFRFEDLFASSKFYLLNPIPLSNNGQALNLEMIKVYTQMNCIQARAQLAAGHWQEALIQLKNYLNFCLDLYVSSVPTTTTEVALESFQITLQEILSVVSLARNKFSASALIENLPSMPWFGSRPEFLMAAAFETETELPGVVVDELESILKKSINKLNPENLMYRDYLYLTQNYFHMERTLGFKKTTYYYIKKFQFWKHFFSRNKYFYHTGFKTYKRLLSGMQYIRNVHDKSIYISDFSRDNKLTGNLLLFRVPRLSTSLLMVRLQAKLVLTAINVLRFGMDSPQFSEFAKSEFFTNDISGKKFKILSNKPSLTIFIDENLQLQIPIFDFPEGYTKSISKSRQFRQIILENPVLTVHKKRP